jgi:hypothetical protein
MWPPEWIIKIFLKWCEEVDPLLRANPLWYRTLAHISPVVYAPFYVLAIYAFINEREWIKIPGTEVEVTSIAGGTIVSVVRSLLVMGDNIDHGGCLIRTVCWRACF